MLEKLMFWKKQAQPPAPSVDPDLILFIDRVFQAVGHAAALSSDLGEQVQHAGTLLPPQLFNTNSSKRINDYLHQACWLYQESGHLFK